MLYMCEGKVLMDILIMLFFFGGGGSLKDCQRSQSLSSVGSVM